MRILIADPRVATRAALTILLGLEPGLQVVGEVGEGAALVPGLAATRPDVVLLEWSLLSAPLAEVLRDLRAGGLRPRVIVLSGRPEVGRLARAAGVDAFISKGDPPGRLLELLRRMARSRGRRRAHGCLRARG